MIADLLPGYVATAHAFGDPAGAHLVPPEDDVVRTASDRRRAEFTTGRHLARAALRVLGVGPVAVPPGPRREPRWPSGVVGSITHCAGYRAAAVATTAAAHTLGIDADVDRPIPGRMLRSIAVAEEQDRLAGLHRDDPGVCWDRVLFSAKESVYKAWSPLTRRPLGFTDAAITIDPAGVFRARLLVPPAALPGGGTLAVFTGRWAVRQGLVLTAVVLPLPAGRAASSAAAGTRPPPVTGPQ